MENTNQKRAALKLVPLDRRRAWAERNPEDCQTCRRYGKASNACPYPSHLWGDRLDRICAELCSGQTAPQMPAVDATEPTDAPTDRQTADKLADAIRDAMAASVPAMDETAVRKIVKDAIAESNGQNVKRLEITVNKDGKSETRDVGLAHAMFPRLLKMIAAGVNVWVAGPTGSGKTHAVEQAANALGLPFYFNGAIDTEYKLSGFVDAGGRVISTPFRRAFTEGGVYLFDEVDASMPAAVLAFNAALSNGASDFPGEDRPVPRHPNFRCVAGANTNGHGATIEYVGRMKMDAAFLDRFAFLFWDYDENLERQLCGNTEWCVYIQKLRAVAKSRGLKVTLSPRASIRGAAMLAQGMSREDVIDCEIRNKMTAENAAALGI